MDWTPILEDRLLTTAALLLGVLLLWAAMRLWASRLSANLELRQKLRNLSTILALLLIPGGLLLIWSAEVHDALLALAAFAVALVVAFKELLLCLVGGLFRLAVSPYDIGDRIEINGLRGDVVDTGLLSSRLLEVGPGRVAQTSTGRMLHLPHAWLLLHPVTNASETGFRWHEIHVRPKAGSDWRAVAKALAEIAETEHAPNRTELDAAVERLRRKVAYRPPPGTPFVFASLNDDAELELTLRYAVPSRQQRVSEDRVVRALLERLGSDAFMQVS